MLGQVVKRPIGVSFITLAFFVLGLMAYTTLPQNLMPTIKAPIIAIWVEKPDASPREIENEIVQDLENKMSTVPGLVSMESFSRLGKAELLLHFRSDVDIDDTINRLREKVGNLRLGVGTRPPRVLRYDPNADPVLRFLFRSKGNQVDLTSLSLDAREKLLPRLEGLPEVASIRLRGLREKELLIRPDAKKMKAMTVTMNELTNAIRNGVSRHSIGEVETAEGDRNVKIIGASQHPSQLPAAIIKDDITIGDLAEVKLHTQEPEELVLHHSGNQQDSEQVLLIEILAQLDVGMVPAAASVKKLLSSLGQQSEGNDKQWDLYGGELQLISDLSEPVRQSLDDVRQAVMQGAALALIVLIWFMRSLRSSIIVFLSIPLSVIITFLFMDRGDVGINLMSMSGMALGVGMLVDNAIVVLESIGRVRESRTDLNRFEATVLGAREVVPAVIASTLTTVAVFLPLTFLEGYIGSLLYDQAFTVSASLFISLFVAVTMVPTLMGLPGLGGSKSKEPGWIAKTIDSPLSLLQFIHNHLMKAMLRFPILGFICFIALLSSTYFLLNQTQQQFMPDVPAKQLSLNIRLADHHDVESSAEWAEDWLKKLPNIGTKYSTTIICGEDRSYATMLGRRLNNEMHVSIDLHKSLENKTEEIEAMRILERSATQYGALNVVSHIPPAMDLGLGEGHDLDLIISGDDQEMLEQANIDISSFLKEKGALGVSSNDKGIRQEVLVIPDNVKLQKVNLRMQEFVSRLENALLEKNIDGYFPIYTEEGASPYMLPVRVLGTHVEQSADQVGDLDLGDKDQVIPLDSIAHWEFERGTQVIYRKDGRRVARVKASILPPELSIEEIIHKLRASLPEYKNLDIEVVHAFDKLKDGMDSMLKMFYLSLFLVVVVMAVQFESVSQPFLVILSVPMALAGSLGLLFLTGHSLNVMSGIGIVILIGVAVNNAIVLVSTANLRKEEGMETRDAISQAARERFRPILMTALTTIMGLLPLALTWSESAALRAPLAIAVIGGLFSSTVLVLFILPSLMVPFMRKKNK